MEESAAEPVPPQQEHDSIIVEVFFEEGPLGVTLHRKSDGKVIVFEILDGSQAVNMDLVDGDELWGVGDRIVGDTPIDKARWQEIVEFIRKSERPLRVQFKRWLEVVEHRRIESTGTDLSPAPASPTCFNEESRTMSGSRSVSQGDPRERTESNDLGIYRSHSNSETDIAVPAARSTSPKDDSGNGRKSSPEGGDENNSSSIEGRAVEGVQSEEEADDEEDYDEHEDDEETRMNTLVSIASTLVLKEKDKSSSGIAGFFGLRSSDKQSTTQSAQEFLVKPGRYLLRSGSMSIDCKTSASVWNSGSLQVKQFYLFNDIFIIASPTNSNYQVEHMLDLHTCKIANGELAWILEDASESKVPNASNSAVTAEMLECSFVVLSPAGLMKMFAKSPSEKDSWLKDLDRAISATIDLDERVIGWKHQFVLGTMHATVLSRDECKVRELLLFVESGRASYLSVDDVDEDGYTALQYACMFRAHGIMRALMQSGADATVSDRRGLSALHWTCLLLDDYGLSVLLNGIFSADLTDSLGHTPLFLACVEGRDLTGKADPVALRNCIVALQGASANLSERSDMGIPVVYYVTSAWQTEAVGSFLASGLIDIHDRAGDRNGHLIHTCMEAKSLRKQVGLATIIKSEKQIPGRKKKRSKDCKYVLGLDLDGPQETLTYANGPETLSVLLKYGARPNSRDASGRTPLHLLAEKELNWTVYGKDAFFLLLDAGARLDESPQCQNLRAKYNFVAEAGSKGVVDEALDKRSQLPALNADSLDSGSLRLEGSEASKVCFPVDGKDKCVMCSVGFTLFRRQHHCRLCSCLCCDDCSKRRIVLSGTQVTN
jgi:ankyrin repeat protein